MVDFNQFAKSLGPHATKYTEEELRQLYGEVLKFADLLLTAHQAAKKNRSLVRRSTGVALDASGQKRTVKRTDAWEE
jgi:hypothetical protein